MIRLRSFVAGAAVAGAFWAGLAAQTRPSVSPGLTADQLFSPNKVWAVHLSLTKAGHVGHLAQVIGRPLVERLWMPRPGASFLWDLGTVIIF